MSLYMSYNAHFPVCLSGGKSFYMDRGFTVTTVTTVFTLGILLMQFKPRTLWDINRSASAMEREYLDPAMRWALLDRIIAVRWYSHIEANRKYIET
jgi:hypothetical protein